MATDKISKLVFIPLPVMGHFVASVKLAALLTDRHSSLSVTVLVNNPPLNQQIIPYTSKSPNPRVTFPYLPFQKLTEHAEVNLAFTEHYVESQKNAIRDAIASLSLEPEMLVGCVMDMFYASMIDVADEFNLPSYLFYPTGSAGLGLYFHLQGLRDQGRMKLEECVDSNEVITIPTFAHPVPTWAWLMSIEESNILLNTIRIYRRMKGIIVNSFSEFEVQATVSLVNDKNLPPVFPVGPILQSTKDGSGADYRSREEIMSWLDQQPDSSIVFLCFGSGGFFNPRQVKEIAWALEKLQGVRFL